MSDLPRSRATAVQALIDEVEEFVGWWGLNREGSVNRTYDHIDKLTKRLAALLLREGQDDEESGTTRTGVDRGRIMVTGRTPKHHEGAIHVYSHDAPTYLCEDCRHQWQASHSSYLVASTQYCGGIDWDYERSRCWIQADKQHAVLREGQEPDWIGKCPKCNRTVLNHGDLCSQCAGLREGQEPPVCQTCMGRRWVMRSETRDYGNGLGAGGMWNQPCPDCAGLREGPPAPPGPAGDAPATEPDEDRPCGGSIFDCEMADALAASQAGTAPREAKWTSILDHIDARLKAGISNTHQVSAWAEDLREIAEMITLAAHGAAPPQEP